MGRLDPIAVLNVVLYQPEIPPNTGNIIRLCANTGTALHLVGPLGFEFDDARLKRAGLDYHEFAAVHRYPDWQSYLEQNGQLSELRRRLWAFSTRGRQRYCEVRYCPGDTLLFGPETRGLPHRLLAALDPGRVLRLPMVPHSRSLNLSNAVAVAVYEVLRQAGFNGLT